MKKHVFLNSNSLFSYYLYMIVQYTLALKSTSECQQIFEPSGINLVRN